MTSKTAAIEKLARDWYSALDTHEPTETLVAMLDPDNVSMVFPEATLEGVEGFIGWYEGVIRIFFDEVHQVTAVTIENETDEKTEIKVVVRWEASRWNPPAANSDRIMLDAYQSWSLSFDADGNPRIIRYEVDKLEYLPGSAQL